MWITMRYVLFLAFILFSFVNIAQSPDVDGYYCDAPDWSMPIGQDFMDDTPTSTADVGNLWIAQNGDTIFVAWSRFALGAGTSSFNLLWDGNCDNVADDLLIELVWGAIGTDEAEPIEVNFVTADGGGFTYDGTEMASFQGQAICGDPFSAGLYSEYYFLLSDLIALGVYDPCDCSCGELRLEVAGSFAGGSFNSAMKDGFDISFAPVTFSGSSGLINCPSALMIPSMDDAQINAWLNTFTASDECGALTLTNNYSPTGFTDMCGQMMQNVTFSASDACGNQNTCMAQLVIGDVTGPALTCPTDIYLECGSTSFATDVQAWLNQVVALDVDGTPLTVNNTYSEENFVHSCGLAGMQAVTFTAMNSCGLMGTCTGYIFREDLTEPTMVCAPGDLVVDCSDPTFDQQLSDWLSSPTSSDVCAEPMVINVMNNYSPTGFTGGCGSQTGSQIITFSAVDFCGNVATCERSVTIVDNSGPAINCPATGDLTLECNDPSNQSLVDSWLTSVTATDDCGSANISNNFGGLSSIGGGCGNTGSVLVVFEASDACGNTSTCSANVIIADTSNPNINCPTNLVLQVGDASNDNQISSWLNSATATDACGQVSITNSFSEGNYVTSCGDARSQTVTFTATDECGNISTCNAEINIQDTTPPTVTCPSDLILECGDAGNDAQISTWLNTFTGSDASGSFTSENTYDPNGFTNICGNSQSQTVTITITDACGLSSSCTATITVQDTSAPSINCPGADLVLECGNGNNDAMITNWLNSVTGIDACDGANLTLSNNYSPANFSSECGGTGRQTVTFTATDGCGNQTTCTGEIIIQDTTPSNITCPAQDLVIECADPNMQTQIAGWLNSVSFSDNCGAGVNISNDYDFGNLVTQCGGAGTILVNFIAEDPCGNQSSCSARIVIQDTSSPTLNCVNNLTLEVGDTNNNNLIQNWLNSVTGSDECGNVSLGNSFSELNYIEDCGASKHQTVTFTATDECGNTSTCQAELVIQDTTPPSVACPQTLVIECGDANEEAQIAAWLDSFQGSDASGSFTVENTYDPNGFANNCGETRSQTVTITITDGCGLSSSCSATISVVDTTPPVLTCPEDLTLDCSDPFFQGLLDVWLEKFIASDACDADVTLQNNFGGASFTTG